MIQDGPAECLRILWVWHLLAPGESSEFAPPPFPHRLYQSWVGVTGKIQKRRGFSVLFSHEEQWNVGRTQHQAGGELECRERHQGAEAVPVGPVAYLVVILATDHKALAGEVATGGAVWPFAKERSLPLVDKSLGDCCFQV